MKRIIDDNEGGWPALLGRKLTFYCGVYIYHGKLVGVNEDLIELEDASIVYDTGAHSDPKFADAEKLPNRWYLLKQNIESLGGLKDAD